MSRRIQKPSFKVAPDSYRYLGILLLLALITAQVHWGWSLFFVGFALCIALFFRDPDRSAAPSEGQILSPADGTIQEIQPVHEDPYFGKRFKTVSIYLSLFDVHVNRLPVAGTIEKILYSSGKFLPAFRKKASRENESNLVVIQAVQSQLMVRQIAGRFARRIVCYLQEGNQVQQGQRLGLIRLGSCVQLYLPESAQLNVQVGQKVKGGESVIGTL